MENHLSIIIVSWRVKDALLQCLKSIFDHGPNLSFEVIVIDNASGDGTAEMVRAEFPRVRLIENQKNLGFARACNQALKHIQDLHGELSRTILFLNPDTTVKQGTLKGIVEYFQKNPRCGIVGGKILHPHTKEFGVGVNPDGSIQHSVRRFPKLSDQLLILLKLHRLFPRLPSLRRYFAADVDYSREQEVDQVMGAFMAVRREVFEKLRGFDEKFFLWFEEVDFCKRAKEAGPANGGASWKVCYTPAVSVTHQGAASFRQLKPLKRQLIWNRSLSWYFRKHHPFWQWIVIQVFQPISLVLAFVTQFLGGSTSSGGRTS